MIKENDYIRAIKEEFPQLPLERELEYRQQFKRMPNTWKKAIDRERVKNKQNMSFAEWWAVVTENVRQGNRITQQNKEAVRGTKHDKLRRELNNNEQREYLGLDPYDDEDYQKVKQMYESNVEGAYEYPDFLLPMKTVSKPVNEEE